MQKIKQHFLIKALAITLVITVSLPAVVKLNHVFENHKHDVCENPQDIHFHNIDIDCEFYKFNLSTVYKITSQDIAFGFIDNNHKIITYQYNYISDFQRLPFSLRGPPLLV